LGQPFRHYKVGGGRGIVADISYECRLSLLLGLTAMTAWAASYGMPKSLS
jgi:hypothetical protein